jgi:plastocyanin
VWSGHQPHNVVKRRGPGGSFNSGVKTHGKTWTHKFTRGGTYKIICTIHSNMKLTVKVR